MLWIFAVIAIVLLLIVLWIDRSRRRRGLVGGIGPIHRGQGYELPGRSEGCGDPGAGGS